MVYRVQEVGKALKGVDYCLHCSSAFNTVDWGKEDKIRHYTVRAWGRGAGGSGPGKFSRGCTASDQRPI